MRQENLPSPGVINFGPRLRSLAANAISYVDVNSRGGVNSEAIKLKAFFEACAAAADEFSEQTPTNSVAPVVSGSTALGGTLSVTTGTWAGGLLNYTYQWKRGASNITGATGATRVITAADQGQNLSCVVTATNAAGSATQASNSVAVPAA